MPANGTSNWNGKIINSNRKNYTTNSSFYYDTSNYCYNSFKDIDKSALKIVVSESWNFGQIIRDSFNSNASVGEQGEADKLKKYFYEFFLVRIGAAPFRGSGVSVKKGANNSGNDGMAYRVYACGINTGNPALIVTLESLVILPK